MKKLYYFYSNSCAPCDTMSPIMDRVGRQLPLEKIDTDYTPDVPERYKVMSIPTVILTKDNQEIARFGGIRSEAQIVEFYNNG